MGKDDLPPLGGKPHGKEKVPNQIRKDADAARKNPPVEDQQQPQDDGGVRVKINNIFYKKKWTYMLV